MPNLGFHAVQEVFLGFLLGQAGDFLQDLHLASLNKIDLILGGGDGGLFFGQVVLFPLVGVHFLIQGFFLLLQAAFLLGKLAAALFDFLFVLGARFMDFVLCLQQHFLLFALAAADGLVDDTGGLFLGASDFPFGNLFPVYGAGQEGRDCNHKANAKDQQSNLNGSHNS